MVTSPDESLSAWEEQGRRVAWALDDANAAVVLSSDPDTGASVAVGIGRVQARRRRVAVIDLVGDVPTLRQLLPEEPTYGVLDHLLYGVSLEKVAYPVDPARNLFIMPSGVGPVALDEVSGHDAWRRLMLGFREVGALVLAVIHSQSADVDQLVTTTEGAVVVGGDVIVAPERVITIVDSPRRQVEFAVEREQRLPGAGDPSAAANPAAPAAGSRRPLLSIAAVISERAGTDRNLLARGRSLALEILADPRRRRVAAWSGGVAAAIGAIAIAVAASTRGPAVPDATGGTTSAQAAGTTVPAAGMLGSEPPPDAVLSVVDSARAADYSLALTSFTSQTGADERLQREENRGAWAATYSPVILGESARWYRVTIGAYGDSVQADSALRSLRARNVIAETEGYVQRSPFALLVRAAIQPDSAGVAVQAWRSRDLPVYALLQDDGTARLYAGAFETPEQASWLLSMFRAAGEAPKIVYRIGRPL